MRLLQSSLLLVTTTAIASTAHAKTCSLEIEGNDAMQFNKKELTIGKDCTEVTLTLKHTGKLPKSAMGHDWVLTSNADMQAVVAAGMQAGATNDYQPKDDKRIVAATKMLGGGESASTTFKTTALKAGTSYKFFCTFPGHSALMTGELIGPS